MASLNVAPETIPGSIRKPGVYFEFNLRLAIRTLTTNLQRVIIIAQKTAAGTWPATSPISVYSSDEAAILFGAGSQAHLMVKAALQANRYLYLDVIAVDDAAAGVAAVKTVTLSGPSTGSGVYTLGIANQAVQVAVASGDTATTIADAVAAQAQFQLDLPMTVTAAAGVLTLTAKNKGSQGQGIQVAASSTASGVTSVIASTATGQTEPSLTNALAAIFSAGHDIIISAWNDAATLTAIRTHLESVNSAIEQRSCIGITAVTTTLAQATTLATALNSGFITPGLAPNLPAMACEAAAAYGAVIAFEEDPARPLNTLQLTGMPVSPLVNRLGRMEIETALHNGVTPLVVGPGNRLQIERAITSYMVNPAGIPDPALLDLTTIRTLNFVRKAVRERLALRFPRDKKTVRIKAKVRSEVIDVLVKLEELEIIENVEEYKEFIVIEDDLQDANRLNIRIPVDVVNGLHVFAGIIDLIL